MARIALTKVGCQDQIVAAFFQRTFGNVQEARFVGLAPRRRNPSAILAAMETAARRSCNANP